MRVINYADAIREAHRQLLKSDPRVFLLGQGLWSPWYAGASLQDLDREFGRNRIIDSPISENATTGAAVGAAVRRRAIRMLTKPLKGPPTRWPHIPIRSWKNTAMS